MAAFEPFRVKTEASAIPAQDLGPCAVLSDEEKIIPRENISAQAVSNQGRQSIKGFPHIDWRSININLDFGRGG